MENFLPFSSNLILSSANSFNFDESTICRFGKGLVFVVEEDDEDDDDNDNNDDDKGEDNKDDDNDDDFYFTH